MTELFPFREYWWFYAAFGGLIAVLLALDLTAHPSPWPLLTRTGAAWSAAITREPLIVYTSNIFAILGLRAIYLTIAGAIEFGYLKYGSSVFLAFVGLKMALLDDPTGGRFPIALSLAVIASVVTASIAVCAFVVRKPREPKSCRAGLGEIALGFIFAALGAVSLALAVGVQLKLLDARSLEEIKAEWLYLSGIGHGVCAGCCSVQRNAGSRGNPDEPAEWSPTC
jgi:hypothetical protein